MNYEEAIFVISLNLSGTSVLKKISLSLFVYLVNSCQMDLPARNPDAPLAIATRKLSLNFSYFPPFVNNIHGVIPTYSVICLQDCASPGNSSFHTSGMSFLSRK